MKKHILFRVIFAGVKLALACAPDTAKNNAVGDLFDFSQPK
jgi:hypothetical protein